jgi:predicted ABC-type ATPase
VPGEDIRRRYERSLENLPEAISLSGRAVLMDNSSSDMKPVPETVHGKLTWLAPDPPNWVRALLYALS